MEKLTYTVKEAAALLGVQPLTVYQNISEIDHIRIGRRILIKKSFIENLSKPSELAHA